MFLCVRLNSYLISIRILPVNQPIPRLVVPFFVCRSANEKRNNGIYTDHTDLCFVKCYIIFVAVDHMAGTESDSDFDVKVCSPKENFIWFGRISASILLYVLQTKLPRVDMELRSLVHAAVLFEALLKLRSEYAKYWVRLQSATYKFVNVSIISLRELTVVNQSHESKFMRSDLCFASELCAIKRSSWQWQFRWSTRSWLAWSRTF